MKSEFEESVSVQRHRGAQSAAGRFAKEVSDLREQNARLRKLYAAQQLQIVALKLQVQREMNLARRRKRESGHG